MRWIVTLRHWHYRRRWRGRRPGEPCPAEALYFLHIGKTGGSFVKHVLKDGGSFTAEPRLLIPFGHNITAAHLPAGAHYLFGVRAPLKRFVSGFESRRRKGEKRAGALSRGERAAYARFADANALAEALSAAEAGTRAEAEAAMRAIRHVNEPHALWFPDRDRLGADLRAGRAHRLRQEALNADLRAALEAEGFALTPGRLEARPRVHTTPAAAKRVLSPLAEANLRRHYAEDLAFLDWVEAQVAG